MHRCLQNQGHKPLLSLVHELLCIRCAAAQFTLFVGQFMELKLSNYTVAVYNAIYFFAHYFVFWMIYWWCRYFQHLVLFIKLQLLRRQPGFR